MGQTFPSTGILPTDTMAKMMAMKMASMKMAMKKMAKRKSKIAKGKFRKVLVFRGSKEKTQGGLKKAALKKNKHGRIVSVKASAAASKGKSAKWADSLRKAYKSLGLKKFTPIKKGSALYKATMSLYK